MHFAAVTGLFFLSGMTGLVFQVLWMRELRLLFGQTAHAAAATLTAFFLGLALGGHWVGRYAARARRPFRVYAALEAGVAGAALLTLPVLTLYHAIYPFLYASFGGWPVCFTLMKLVLALLALVPPAFCMGGTLPMLAEHAVAGRRTLGKAATGLYAVNTLGAAAGAYLAGFHLPLVLGFSRAYALNVGVVVGVAGLAFLLSRGQGRPAPPVVRPVVGGRPEPGNTAGAPAGSGSGAKGPLGRGTVRILAGVSGFVTLGMEVLWTRMFAQVLHNSVYTFALILVLFLMSLALGGLVARGLIRYRWPPAGVLVVLMAMAGLAVGVSPFVFHAMTDGMGYLGGGEGWAGYLVRVFGIGLAVIGLPCVLLGIIFPYLFDVAGGERGGPGRTVGDLVAVNTVGGVLGSWMVGFVLLDALGLWGSLQLLGAVYGLAALLLADRVPRGRVPLRVAAAVVVLLMVSLLNPARLALVRVDPVGRDEALVAVYEGSAGVVAVVKRGEALKIKMNNHYTLGGTGAMAFEKRQSHLPLLLHPRPRRVCYIGMGTGITAGAALDHPVERVVVTELAPEAVRAARAHFGPYVNGLFEDPRVEVRVEDGRNHLLGTRDRYDLIVADLFIPWRAGVGGLYSREHYEAARRRLAEGGLYAQWLPMYQLSRGEFGIIARSMLEVFPSVTMWRGDFLNDEPIVMLLGARGGEPMDPEALRRRWRAAERAVGQASLAESAEGASEAAGGAQGGAGRTTGAWGALLLHYTGNLSAAAERFAADPVNTDDRPLIDFHAPIIQRRVRAGRAKRLTGRAYLGLLESMAEAVLPEVDPFLARVPDAERRFVRAGLELHRARVFRAAGDRKAYWQAMMRFRRAARGR